MAREYLITPENFDKYKPLAKYCNTFNTISPYILEAQLFDISPMLSDKDEMLNDLLSTPENTTTGKNGDLLKLLEPMCVYYAYARYLPGHDIVPTASGLKRKLNEHSEAIKESDISRLINNATSNAAEYAVRVEKFIQDNLTAFPLYKPLKYAKEIGITIRAVDVNEPCRNNDNWKYKY